MAPQFALPRPKTPEERLFEIASSRSAPNMAEVETLIAQIPSVNISDGSQISLLHWAAVTTHLPLIMRLIRAGAQINGLTIDGSLATTLCASTTSDHRITQHHSAYVTLLQYGSHFPNLESQPLIEPNFFQQREIWFGTCRDAWEKWTQKDGGDVTRLTPRMLLQFTSLETIEDALAPSRWRGHEDHLRTLLGCPDIPPCHITNWLETISGLAELVQPPATPLPQSWASRLAIPPSSAATRST